VIQRKVIVFGVLGLIATGAVGVGVIFASGSAKSTYVPASDGPVQGNFTVNDAASFNDFALYSLGVAFEGLPLTAIDRRKDVPRDEALANANWVNFIYGDCVADDPARPESHSGCSPPLQVQVWPACERNPALWGADSAAIFGEREAVTVRGVPAYYYFEGTQIDIQTDDVTIVIFGSDRDQLVRAANALVPLNAKAFAAMNLVEGLWPRLPEPLEEALNGTLLCY